MGNLAGAGLGAIVVLVVLAVKVIWLRPPERFPPPPPGYKEWLQKATKQGEEQ